jgi:hypothetical protein
MINRRQFFQRTGAGALSLMSGGLGSLLAPPFVSAEGKTGNDFDPDLEISMNPTGPKSRYFREAQLVCGATRVRC